VLVLVMGGVGGLNGGVVECRMKVGWQGGRLCKRWLWDWQHRLVRQMGHGVRLWEYERSNGGLSIVIGAHGVQVHGGRECRLCRNGGVACWL